jgi:hypothetical protein
MVKAMMYLKLSFFLNSALPLRGYFFKTTRPGKLYKYQNFVKPSWFTAYLYNFIGSVHTL